MPFRPSSWKRFHVHSHTCPHHWKITTVMFSFQFTPQLLSIFNALFIHRRFQERAKSAGNLLSLRWPQQRNKRLFQVPWHRAWMHGMSFQPRQVGTSAVIWQRAKPGSSAVKPLSSYPIRSNWSSFNVRVGACLCLLHNQPRGQGLVKREQEHPDRWFGHTPVLWPNFKRNWERSWVWGFELTPSLLNLQ